jgi:isopenicillin-N N-acyltransferase like protein
MNKEFNYFPLYEFSGTEREIGRQYGEQCKEDIKHTVEWWYSNLAQAIPGNRSLPDMIDATKAFAEPIKNYAPEIYDQMVGIAEGSGCTFDEIVFINGGVELDAAFPAFMGCTSFACSGKATIDGKTICGQNLDWLPGVAIYALKLKPKNKPAILTFTWAGCVAMTGISELGLSHFTNILLCPEAQVGVPWNIICQKILCQKNVGDQMRVIAQAKRAIAFNHLLAGKDGEIISVETTPDKCGFVLPDRDILAHSNHYLCHFLQQDDLNEITSFPDSYLRQYRLQQLMEEHRGKLSPEIMMQLLQDHRGYPDSICRHLDLTGPTFEQFESQVSMVALPGEGKIYATANPCENPTYKLYSL